MSSLVDGRPSLGTNARLAISAALLGVSAMLCGEDVHLQLRGAHEAAQVTELERVSSGRRGRTQIRTHVRFTTEGGQVVQCVMGDVHVDVGRTVAIRYLPPAHCARAGDFRSAMMFGGLGVLGLVGIGWALKTRPRR